MEVEPKTQETKVSPNLAQIHALSENEKRMTRLLVLAGQTVSSLVPRASETTMGQEPSETERFAREYFAELNEIQIVLRTAIAKMRARRISLLTLTTTKSTIAALGSTVAPGGIALPVKGETSPVIQLGRGASELETQAWRDLKLALRSIKPP